MSTGQIPDQTPFSVVDLVVIISLNSSLTKQPRFTSFTNRCITHVIFTSRTLHKPPQRLEILGIEHEILALAIMTVDDRGGEFVRVDLFAGVPAFWNC